MEKKERDWERSAGRVAFDVRLFWWVSEGWILLQTEKTTLIEENGTYFNLFKCSERLSR